MWKWSFVIRLNFPDNISTWQQEGCFVGRCAALTPCWSDSSQVLRPLCLMIRQCDSLSPVFMFHRWWRLSRLILNSLTHYSLRTDFVLHNNWSLIFLFRYQERHFEAACQCRKFSVWCFISIGASAEFWKFRVSSVSQCWSLGSVCMSVQLLSLGSVIQSPVCMSDQYWSLSPVCLLDQYWSL